jgi:uncharacterized protein YgiM (DUF1202 family)
MEKLILLITGLALLASLMGCASATPTPRPTLAPTPNADQIIPLIGLVIVKSVVTKADLHTGPGEAYPLVATMLPGQKAQLIGITSKQDWCLVKFGELTGWGPVDAFDAIIAN